MSAPAQLPLYRTSNSSHCRYPLYKTSTILTVVVPTVHIFFFTHNLHRRQVMTFNYHHSLAYESLMCGPRATPGPLIITTQNIISMLMSAWVWQSRHVVASRSSHVQCGPGTRKGWAPLVPAPLCSCLTMYQQVQVYSGEREGKTTVEMYEWWDLQEWWAQRHLPSHPSQARGTISIVLNIQVVAPILIKRKIRHCVCVWTLL